MCQGKIEGYKENNRLLFFWVCIYSFITFIAVRVAVSSFIAFSAVSPHATIHFCPLHTPPCDDESRMFQGKVENLGRMTVNLR